MPSSPDPLDDLAKHPGLLAELEGAAAAGVSWRRFTGWEPARITEYEYEDGQLVRAVTTTEPEWDDEQRHAVHALLRYRAGLCPGCRNPLSETADPVNEYGYVRPLGPPLRCHYCTMLGIYQESDKDLPHAESLLYHLDRKPQEQDADAGDG